MTVAEEVGREAVEKTLAAKEAKAETAAMRKELEAARRQTEIAAKQSEASGVLEERETTSSPGPCVLA